MSTKRKTTNKYQRYTPAQLVSFIKKWHKKHASLAKTPASKTKGGWTPQQQRAYIMGELKGAARALRFNTLCDVDVKLKALKRDIAKKLGVTFNSSKATSPAIKRLKAIRKQVSKCVTVPGTVAKCSTVKLTSFKNPSRVAGTKRKTTTVKSRRITRVSRVSTQAVSAKYQKQTKVLKKEIQKLKQRNMAMKNLVAKFRKEVAQMQNHYGTLKTQAPRWKVISNKKVNQDVSNIVRFSNALSNAMQKQRKAG